MLNLPQHRNFPCFITNFKCMKSRQEPVLRILADGPQTSSYNPLTIITSYHEASCCQIFSSWCCFRHLRDTVIHYTFVLRNSFKKYFQWRKSYSSKLRPAKFTNLGKIIKADGIPLFNDKYTLCCNNEKIKRKHTRTYYIDNF